MAPTKKGSRSAPMDAAADMEEAFRKLRISGASYATAAVDKALAALRARYSGGTVPIDELDRVLGVLFESLGISMNKFKEVVGSKGICLRNCVEYGSPEALRAALRANRKLILPRSKAKQYKYAKRCLIIL